MDSVREIMTGNPTTVDGRESVTSVARTMRDDGVDVVLVVEGGALRGLVSDHDLVVRALAEAADAEKLTVAEVVRGGGLVTVDIDDGLDNVARLMEENSVRQVAVIESGSPVGVVNASDPRLQGRSGRIDSPTPEFARKSRGHN
ncbi:CBS domain-containing protein [Streptomyces bauhiniae]|uniref:CBS domain-containing protein n=1 Tax=Streptomyces bauhiniae TaxID=2340725 RepID=A0A7K3QWY9_9ACTN|nr:CBS domain-containing protein [Streptomyces bauhiniae]NEB94393.1 CBS domain-containing protein [Streptomyces bauhiniae]